MNPKRPQAPELVEVICQYRWREPAGLRQVVISYSSCLIKVTSSSEILKAFRKKMNELDREGEMLLYTPKNGRSTF